MAELVAIVYGDQRDGHGTAHWWRLYYGDRLVMGLAVCVLRYVLRC